MRIRRSGGGLRQARFRAWTGIVRASVDLVEGLVAEARMKERRLRDLLSSPAPDPAAIGALVIQLDACCKKIERIRRATLAGFRGGNPASGAQRAGACS